MIENVILLQVQAHVEGKSLEAREGGRGEKGRDGRTEGKGEEREVKVFEWEFNRTCFQVWFLPLVMKYTEGTRKSVQASSHRPVSLQRTKVR